MFRDYREPLVQIAIQLLIVTLDHDVGSGAADDQPEDEADSGQPDNLFVNYLSRIHRDEVSFSNRNLNTKRKTGYLILVFSLRLIEELSFLFSPISEVFNCFFFQDFNFILHGMTRLLNNPLQQTYLPNSIKKIQFHQELLVFLWKVKYDNVFDYS